MFLSSQLAGWMEPQPTASGGAPGTRLESDYSGLITEQGMVYWVLAGLLQEELY